MVRACRVPSSLLQAATSAAKCTLCTEFITAASGDCLPPAQPAHRCCHVAPPAAPQPPRQPTAALGASRILLRSLACKRCLPCFTHAVDLQAASRPASHNTCCSGCPAHLSTALAAPPPSFCLPSLPSLPAPRRRHHGPELVQDQPRRHAEREARRRPRSRLHGLPRQGACCGRRRSRCRVALHPGHGTAAGAWHCGTRGPNYRHYWLRPGVCLFL